MKETLPDGPLAATGRGEAPAPDTAVKVSGTPEQGMTVTNTQAGTQKTTVVGGVKHVEASKAPMSMLAEALSRYLDRLVVDMTEIKGNYQVALDISPEESRNAMRAVGAAMPSGAGGATDTASEPGSSVLTGVQQLVLKLEARKMPLEFIVIDHPEKLPTEN